MSRVGQVLVAVAISLLLGAFAFLVVAFTYFSATGGLHATRKVQVNGVECVEVYNRLSGSVSDVSCPVVRR